MTGGLNDRHLHAKTDAKKRHFLDAGVAHGLDLAFRPPLAETAWYDDAVNVFKMRAPGFPSRITPRRPNSR